MIYFINYMSLRPYLSEARRRWQLMFVLPCHPRLIPLGSVLLPISSRASFLVVLPAPMDGTSL